MSSQATNSFDEWSRIRLKAAPIADLEQTSSDAVGVLVGEQYKAHIDGIEFEKNPYWRGKAKIILRLERVEPEISLPESPANMEKEKVAGQEKPESSGV